MRGRRLKQRPGENDRLCSVLNGAALLMEMGRCCIAVADLQMLAGLVLELRNKFADAVRTSALDDSFIWRFMGVTF